mmetsp:Transcript_26937/g.54864  ORF Transcript_26937/g.54864 Transcript_26937/m.54864 type:complete len:216 (+) Transcript_26937:569-1216(+)
MLALLERGTIGLHCQAQAAPTPNLPSDSECIDCAGTCEHPIRHFLAFSLEPQEVVASFPLLDCTVLSQARLQVLVAENKAILHFFKRSNYCRDRMVLRRNRMQHNNRLLLRQLLLRFSWFYKGQVPREMSFMGIKLGMRRYQMKKGNVKRSNDEKGDDEQRKKPPEHCLAQAISTKILIHEFASVSKAPASLVGTWRATDPLNDEGSSVISFLQV